MKYDSWGQANACHKPSSSLSRVANKLKLKYAVHKVLWQHATVWAFWNVFQLFLSSLHWAIGRAALCFVLYATLRFRFGSVLVSQCVAFFHFLAFGFEGFNQDWRLTHVAPFLCLSFGDENFSFVISFSRSRSVDYLMRKVIGGRTGHASNVVFRLRLWKGFSSLALLSPRPTWPALAAIVKVIYQSEPK